MINRFGGSCATATSRPSAQFDLVCEDDHGCEPLPIGDDVIEAVQELRSPPHRSLTQRDHPREVMTEASPQCTIGRCRSGT